ncbi:hypothetical protein ACJ70E_19750 [Pseudomonas plecoglossicida]|uniref:hypothetical protein n=1 Tax=Pseudomonas plecoglossicida TaxID=70775 RepID=UPI00397745B3
MPTTDRFDTASVDHVIERQLPEWLTRAKAQHLQGYQDAVQAQQASVERLRHLLDGIPSIEAYAAPLLEKALSGSACINSTHGTHLW